jgi:HAD superfamily hydrolase (TIGR01662 family)
VTAVRGVLFDLGDTLIDERVDDAEQLDRMPLHARPDALQVLTKLSERFSLALVTDTETSREPAVRRALSRLGLERFFDAVVTSQDLGVSKPDPAMFQEALRRIRVLPEEAVMVGNDLDRDVEGAARLGLRTILVTNSRYYDPARTTTAHVVPTLSEAADLVVALDAGEATQEVQP